MKTKEKKKERKDSQCSHPPTFICCFVCSRVFISCWIRLMIPSTHGLSNLMITELYQVKVVISIGLISSWSVWRYYYWPVHFQNPTAHLWSIWYPWNRDAPLSGSSTPELLYDILPGFMRFCQWTGVDIVKTIANNGANVTVESVERAHNAAERFTCGYQVIFSIPRM